MLFIFYFGKKLLNYETKKVPIGLHLHSLQPFPDCMSQYVSLHSPQSLPTTLLLHVHCPFVKSHSELELPNLKQSHAWHFTSLNAFPQYELKHLSQLSPVVLCMHFKHFPVKPSQLPIVFSSIFALHVHFWQIIDEDDLKLKKFNYISPSKKFR